MKRRFEMPKEISNVERDNNRCSSKVFVEKEENGKYVFRDLRTTVEFTLLNEPGGYDFTKKELSALKRLINYKTCKAKFDIDYCHSVRSKYLFCVMSDLYEILWEIPTNHKIINSGETLVSADRNIARCRDEIKKRKGQPVGVNWKQLKKDVKNYSEDKELEEFAHAVATIGNFMAVPASHQKLLASMDERYDKVLHLLRAYYYCYFFKDVSFDFIVFDDIKEWLNTYLKENGEDSWKNFVDCNYLNGSFVDDKDYSVIDYKNELGQLSELIYKRSLVMIKKYDELRTAEMNIGMEAKKGS